MGKRPKYKRGFRGKDLLRAVKRGAADTLDEIEFVLIPLAQKYTPIKEGELISSFTYKTDRGRLSSNISNTAEHYGFVELGTTRAKNYHKPEGVVFRVTRQYKGLLGARMTQQAVDELVAKGIITRSLTINVQNYLPG